MKVLVITNNISSNSGWGRYSLSIINEYSNFDIDYKVISEAKNKENKNELNILLPPSSINNFFTNILNIRRIASDCDIIHAFDGWPYSIYAYFAVLGTNKKMFINGVGSYSVAPFDNKFKSFLLSKAYRRAKKIFCISNYTKKRISEKIDLKNLEVVFMGNSSMINISDNTIDQYASKYNIKDENYPIFLSVGAIKGRKGQYYSLQAIAKLSSRYPNFRYYIIGSESEIDYIDIINKYIEKNNLFENVKIIRNASEEELSFFYSISDIFILNSVNSGNHFEGFGLVFLEAAQFGLPVIGSKDCGAEDAIGDGYNGYLVNQKDVEDIYQHILKILNKNNQDIRVKSKEFAKRFSWHKTVSQYYEYYNKL